MKNPVLKNKLPLFWNERGSYLERSRWAGAIETTAWRQRQDLGPSASMTPNYLTPPLPVDAFDQEAGVLIKLQGTNSENDQST